MLTDLSSLAGATRMVSDALVMPLVLAYCVAVLTNAELLVVVVSPASCEAPASAAASAAFCSATRSSPNSPTKTGEPWWSEAEITLNGVIRYGELQVSGRRDWLRERVREEGPPARLGLG